MGRVVAWFRERRLEVASAVILRRSYRRADVEAGFCGGCGQALRLRIANRRGS